MKDEFSSSRLPEEIQKRIKIAAEALLNDDKKTAQENIEWINLSQALIDKNRKSPGKVKLSVLIGLVTVCLLSLGLILRLPKTNVMVDVKVKSVTLKPENDYILNNRFSVSDFSVSNLKEVEALGADINYTNEQPFTIKITGQSIVIDKIELSGNSEISFGLQNNVQNFVIKNDSISMAVLVGKAAIDINNGELDTLVDYEVPEIFNIKSFFSIGIPINIMFTDTASWSLRDIPISEINFLEENPPGAGKFSSSIVSGKVTILEIDKEYSLEEGDWLRLEHLKNRRIQLSKSNNEIGIHLEGEVSEVSAGTELFKKKLNPTIAEYLFHAKFFAFVWSCIIFLWSFLWSIKNSLFTK